MAVGGRAITGRGTMAIVAIDVTAMRITVTGAVGIMVVMVVGAMNMGVIAMDVVITAAAG